MFEVGLKCLAKMECQRIWRIYEMWCQSEFYVEITGVVSNSYNTSF